MRTTERITIDGHPVELIFAVVGHGDIWEHLEMAWKVEIDGEIYGMNYPLEKVTRKAREALISYASEFIRTKK
jgi:hypothetical protein